MKPISLSRIANKSAFAALALSVASLVSAAEKIVIKGSDTLGAKMVPQLAEEFKAIKSKQGVEVIFEIAAEGSSTGVAAVIDSTADLGMSSREAKKTEESKALLKGVKMTPIEVAKDGIAIIANEKNPMDEISSREVEKIFTGDVIDWSSINGVSGDISIYTRNTSSGTYAVFQEMALRKRDYAGSSQKMAGNEQIASEVAKNPNGIGYVGLAYLGTQGIKTLPVDGVTPEKKNYPYARPVYFYYDGNAKMRPIVKEFVDFCLSKEGQKIVEDVHFISIL
ncbi:phosphate ABC transporter substrate-binding protein [Pelagicoccus sp. SDUM812002]|uniref:phosphate ABC transporter substrate-binding protein n=1 Tax=Pelagicoccus sp. SDUM812002 TaxID=3041266 RepID=UPI00280EB46B|nr:phosphate ABC transporter substrate-binding protein [Pelagicoccus sp. SDUM812002]MDQ8187849.1 phosphate ABC transporter substrate-binding protein [Pelagicoccus sp. SDUM812002]